MGYICTICTDSLEIAGDKAISVSCGHTFHDKCIREWLGNASKCPLCNRFTTVNNIHSLYLSSENNQTAASRSRLQNNLKSASINQRQAKEELAKVQEALRAAELKASDALAVNRYLKSEIDRKAPYEYELKHVKEECERLKSEKIALERVKQNLNTNINEKNAIISRKDISIEKLETQIRKQNSEIASHKNALNNKDTFLRQTLNRQEVDHRNALKNKETFLLQTLTSREVCHRHKFERQDDLFQEILKDKENKIAVLKREMDAVVKTIAVDYYDRKEIQNDIKVLTSDSPDFTTGQVLQDTHQAHRKTEFFSFLFE